MKKKPKPRPRPRPPYVTMAALALVLCVTPSCISYQVAKQEVWPGVKQVIVGACPHMAEALFQDLINLLGWPVDQVESLVKGKTEPAPIPPAN